MFMNFREFLEAKPGEVEKASKCENLEEFKKLVDEARIDYKDEEEVKSAYNFVKGENGELSDDLLESASGGKSSLMIYEKWRDLKFKYRNREFWCRGYYVDTAEKMQLK